MAVKTYSGKLHVCGSSGVLRRIPANSRQPRIASATLGRTISREAKPTTDQTFVFDAPDIVTGLSNIGYHTICIGGVGFFNKQSPLGSVLPSLFHESHWSPSLGVTCQDSTRNQIDVALRSMSLLAPEQRVFLFLNVSALHQPNCMYIEGRTEDSPETQAAALSYVDSQLPRLFGAMRRRSDVFCIICSDHGTAYGEDGYVGHRLAHPVVWNVPYAEVMLTRES